MAVFPSEIGPFAVLEPLGRGGLAQVWSVRDTSGDIYALKRLRSNRRGRKRFLREYEVLANLDCVGVPKAHAFFENSEMNPFFIMECMDGRPAYRALRDAGAPGSKKRMDLVEIVLAHMARILGELHAQSIVHRDVKSQNVLVDADGKTALVDFGAVLVHAPSRPSRARVGTCAYSAPEMLMGKSVDHRVDIYSLGVLLYRLVTGVNPFRGQTRVDTVSRHLVLPAPRPTEFLGSVPPRLCELILAMVEKAPENRPQSCSELGFA